MPGEEAAHVRVDPEEAARRGSISGRLSGTARTLSRYAVAGTGVGVGVGGLTGLPSLILDKTGYAATISAIGGAISGLVVFTVSGIYRARADGRRAMIEAESGEDRRLRIEAQRLADEATRQRDECRREHATVLIRLAALDEKVEAQGRKHDDDIRALRAKHEADIREERSRYDELINRVFGRDKRHAPPRPGA